MRREFGRYCRALQMGDALIRRVNQLERQVQSLSAADMERIFINDAIQSDGGRQYQGLVFFSSDSSFEIKNFPQGDSVDIDSIRNNIVNMQVSATEFDFKVASSKSRLTAHLNMATGNFLWLTASAENCSYLMDVIRAFLVPNFYRPASS